MSLFRTAVVLSVAIALLPSDKGKQQQLYQQAVTMANDAATYCERNAETCAKAAEYWEQFKVKAVFAAGMARDALQRYSGDTTGESDAADATAGLASPESAVVTARGTLTAEDLEPAWRVSKPRKGI